MKMLVLFVAAFVGLACAGEYAGKGKGYEVKNEIKVEYHEERDYKRQLVYHGRYSGKCGNDGFYYNDKYSFIICSNGNAYTQKCAPGSENSGYSHYEYGKQYYYHDFCDVNLVDEGYAARRAGYYGPYDGYSGPKRYDGDYGYGGGYGYERGYERRAEYGERGYRAGYDKGYYGY